MSTKNNSLRGGKLAGGQGATPTASASSNSKKAPAPKKTTTINTAASPMPVASIVAAPTENENDANMGHASADQDAGMSDDEDSALLLRMESDVSLPRGKQNERFEFQVESLYTDWPPTATLCLLSQSYEVGPFWCVLRIP